MKQNKKKHYENEFKKRIVRLHLEEGRTLKSLAAEYNISHGSISNWIKIYREECQVNPQSKEEYDLMSENQNLESSSKKPKRRTSS